MLLMGTSDWTFKNKPYNLRERLCGFACVIIRLVQYLHTRGPIAIELSAQLLTSSNSAAANYEEADDATSPRDRIAKTLIVLRELKETRVRLRILRSAGLLTEEHDPVIAENLELVKIVATIIRKSKVSGPAR
jgi:four helix bundle protein